MKPQRILPADVYDALELSALAFGGIGAGAWIERYAPAWSGSQPAWEAGDIPLCYVGHLAATGAIPSVGVLEPFGIDEMENDRAVGRVLKQLGTDGKRISFKRWCRELNVVRGE